MSFRTVLEKKSRGRGVIPTRPWAVRTFVLDGQSLSYFDGDKMKGSINIAGGRCYVIAEADHKDFPFALDFAGETLLLNAASDEGRQQAIRQFNLAASDVNWTSAQHMSVGSGSGTGLSIDSFSGSSRLGEQEEDGWRIAINKSI